MSSNGEHMEDFQVNKKVSDDNTRTTVCTTGLSRKIQTSKFQSLTITREVTDNISWSTMKERDMKLKHATKLAIIDYQSVFDEVLKECRLQEVNAYYVDSIAESKQNNPIELD